MKNHKMAALAILIGIAVFFASCGDRERFDFTGNIETFDQVIAQNHVFVEEVVIDRSGWVVVHESNNGEPGAIISAPAYIGTSGRFTNNFIPLDSSAVLTDSMEVVIGLYYDEGTLGVFDAADQPVVVNEEPVTATAILVAPKVTVGNQPIEDHTIVVEEVVTGVRSWVAIYQVNSQGDLGDLVGFSPIDESLATEVQVQLADTLQYNPGDMLAAILHINNPPAEQFVFPGNDVPLVFGFEENNLVYDSFIVQ